MTARFHQISGSSGASVQLRDPRVVQHSPNAFSVAHPARDATAKRLPAWILRSIILATTGFALLDLFLLVSSVHH
jgi:hypothetical protein